MCSWAISVSNSGLCAALTELLAVGDLFIFNLGEGPMGVHVRLTRGVHFGQFANRGDGIPPQNAYWLLTLL